MTQVYEVFTKLSMVNGVSPVLAVLSKEILSLEGSINRLQAAFNNLNRTSLAIGGGLALFGGTAALSGMSKMVEHGEKLVHVKQQLMAADVKGAELAEATARSWELSRKYGLGVAEVLKDIKEARMVFGTTEHAIGFIEPLERMRVVLNSVTDGSGNRAKESVYEMARAGELKGLQTPQEFMSYFEGMTKAITASGGKVDPKAFMQATMYGKLASAGWDEEFYTRYLPTIIQEMRPSTAGQSLMSLFGTLVQGKAAGKAVAQMDQYGLIGDPSKLFHNKAGDVTGMQPGAIKEYQLLIKNPYLWAQTVMMPELAKRIEGPISPRNPEVIAALSGMFGNRNSAAVAAILGLQHNRIEKDAGLIGQAHGLGYADNLLRNDPTAVMNKFKSAFDNLLTAFTEPMVAPKLKMMNAVADGMNKLSAWAVANPASVELLGKALFGVAAGLTALGATALVTALAPLIGGGGLLLGLATGLSAFAALHWPEMVTYTKSFAAALAPFFTFAWKAAIAGLQGLIDLIKTMPAILSEVATAIGRLFEWIKGAVSSAGSWLGGMFSRTGFGGGGGGGVSFNGANVIRASTDPVANAAGMLGAHEQVNNADVQEYLRTGGVGMNPAKTAWCAAFVNASLAKAGIKGTGSAAALSFLNWGSAVNGNAHRGDIFVKAYGGGHGHVGMLTGRFQNGMAEMISGNYGNRVSTTWENLRRGILRRGFTSSTGGAHEQIVLNIDGETLGRVASKYIARHHQHTRQAPYFNGRGMFASNDVQFAVG